MKCCRKPKLDPMSNLRKLPLSSLSALNFLRGHMVAPPPPALTTSCIRSSTSGQHGTSRGGDVSAAQSPSPSLHPSCRRRWRGRKGGRDEEAYLPQLLGATAGLLCIPEPGIHVKIASFLWRPSLPGETKAGLVSTDAE